MMNLQQIHFRTLKLLVPVVNSVVVDEVGQFVAMAMAGMLCASNLVDKPKVLVSPKNNNAANDHQKKIILLDRFCTGISWSRMAFI
jgi:hypothetical protein